PLIAGFYLAGALTAYRRWGALGKAKYLAEEYREYMPANVFAQSMDQLHSNLTSTGSMQARSLDIATVLKSSQAISSEIVLDKLLRRLVSIVMENAGARRCVLLLDKEQNLFIEAEGTVDPEFTSVMQGIPLEKHKTLPDVLINYVVRSHSDLVLDDATIDGDFTDDPYVVAHRVRSILCTPILHQGSLTGVLYLENSLVAGAFTSDRLDLLRQLAAQVAISVENARLYRNLDQARDEAVAADRAKTRFLMSMSHELRTPLNAVIGYTELIEEEAEEGDILALRSDLNRIRLSATRLLRTLSGILELSRLEAGKMELDRSTFDLAALLTEAIDEVQEMADQRQNRITLLCAPGRYVIRTDQSMLHYSVLSLLDNACRFTDSGEIRVTVEPVDRKGEAWIRIAVRDTGIGIPETHVNRIFSSFSQVDESPSRTYDGTGVSLAVTQRFCRMMGGTVEVESQIGQGSVFTILLPDTHIT
ncbi:MAG TPA: sensor histidine kinase, partial [Nannocystis exedens]|nr:sensor histidine kinase [Nannocystis exedens]